MDIINKNKTFSIATLQDTSLSQNNFEGESKENKFNLSGVRTIVNNPQPIELNLQISYVKNDVFFRMLDLFLTFSANAINNVKFHYISNDFVAFGMQLSSYATATGGSLNTADIRLSSRTPPVEATKETGVGGAFDLTPLSPV